MAIDAVLINSETLGSGDDTLGRILMGNFLRLLGERKELPVYIILLNAGVKLATNSSDALDYLKRLQERGVHVISCRTCVDYFGIEDDILAGVIEGMVKIEDILFSSNVLTI